MNPNFVIGYTDTETVKLDLDNVSSNEANYWAHWTMRTFRLDGFIILKSSMNHYHIVFDRPVSWSKNVRIVAWVALKAKHRRLTEWLIMQCIKQGSTLRIGPKKEEKAAPRIVQSYGTRCQQIRCFLRFRKFARALLLKLEARARTKTIGTY